MTYKLINNATKEETICSLVTIDGFEYYISDEIAGFTYNKPTYNSDGRIGLPENNQSKKVIATNNPNIDIAQIIDNSENCYSLNKQDLRYIFDSGNAGSGGSMYNRVRKYSGFDDFLDKDAKIQTIFKNNKAKETWQFTEKDMIEFAKWLFTDCSSNGPFGFSYNNKAYSNKELLSIWKEQQLKIIYYE